MATMDEDDEEEDAEGEEEEVSAVDTDEVEAALEKKEQALAKKGSKRSPKAKARAGTSRSASSKDVTVVAEALKDTSVTSSGGSGASNMSETPSSNDAVAPSVSSTPAGNGGIQEMTTAAHHGHADLISLDMGNHDPQPALTLELPPAPALDTQGALGTQDPQPALTLELPPAPALDTQGALGTQGMSGEYWQNNPGEMNDSDWSHFDKTLTNAFLTGNFQFNFDDDIQMPTPDVQAQVPYFDFSLNNNFTSSNYSSIEPISATPPLRHFPSYEESNALPSTFDLSFPPTNPAPYCVADTSYGLIMPAASSTHAQPGHISSNTTTYPGNGFPQGFATPVTSAASSTHAQLGQISSNIATDPGNGFPQGFATPTATPTTSLSNGSHLTSISTNSTFSTPPSEGIAPQNGFLPSQEVSQGVSTNYGSSTSNAPSSPATASRISGNAPLPASPAFAVSATTSPPLSDKFASTLVSQPPQPHAPPSPATSTQAPDNAPPPSDALDPTSTVANPPQPHRSSQTAISHQQKSPLAVCPGAAQAHSHPVPSATINNDSQRKPLGESLAENRRSSRPVIPSKRLDEMNKIGDKAFPLSATNGSAGGKENLAPGEVPEWAALAKSHLLVSSLGPEWSACVESWLQVEDQLGYGTLSGSRGGLPAASRPSEWARWSAKSKNGIRPYHTLPVLSDPAEFGAAFSKWWCDIQPSFRRSETGPPIAVYINPNPLATTDDWKELQKAGPNGLVVLMTMLYWWGQSLGQRTQWQDDSSSEWKTMVVDVSLCLRSIGASICNKRKRKAESVKEGGKRARI